MKPLSIVLVDDNPMFLRIATRYLATSYPAELALGGTAGTAEEALELALRQQPDAVVADLALPCLSGLELIGRLRKQRADMVIVALTIHDDEAHRQAALAAGADAFVGKANLGTDLVPALLRAARARQGEPELETQEDR
jgi:DNA-binding NarL/FixJ family response regulator